MSSLARQFLALSGTAILAYLILAHASGAGQILNGLGTNGAKIYDSLEGR